MSPDLPLELRPPSDSQPKQPAAGNLVGEMSTDAASGKLVFFFFAYYVTIIILGGRFFNC